MREKAAKHLGRWWLPASLIGGVVALTLAFWLALCAAALIPADVIEGNLEDAQSIVEQEGDYPLSYITGKGYDNFTVKAMLAQVANVGQGDSAFTEALAPGYARYWHGYVVLLRPLFAFCGLYQIRFACQAVFALLFGVSLTLLCVRLKHMGALAACSLVLAEAAVGAFDAVVCLPVFCSFALSLIGTIWVLWPNRMRDRPKQVSRAGFFLIGALTVYFDFLDNPIVALGLPLAAMVSRLFYEQAELRSCAALVASCAVLWFAGYGLLWAAKWVLATLVIGVNVVDDAMEVAQFRVGVGQRAVEEDTSALFAIRRNIAELGAMSLLIFASALACCVMAARSLASRDRSRRQSLGWMSLLVAVALLPYAWYLVLSNHSVIHYAITYRNQVVALFALGLALAVPASSRCGFSLAAAPKEDNVAK